MCKFRSYGAYMSALSNCTAGNSCCGSGTGSWPRSVLLLVVVVELVLTSCSRPAAVGSSCCNLKIQTAVQPPNANIAGSTAAASHTMPDSWHNVLETFDNYNFGVGRKHAAETDRAIHGAPFPRWDRLFLTQTMKSDDVAMTSTSDALLDTIIFASPSKTHNMKTINATVELHADATVDCRRALVFDRTHGGRVLFDMQVSPDKVTHLSVKYWGSVSSVNGTPFEKQGNTWLLDPTCKMSRKTRECTTPRWQQYGWSHSWPCELDQADPGRSTAADGPFPRRWQYVTYPIPREWTTNKTVVRLGLGTGLFQWYGGPAYMPSRPLFKAYTHVDPYLAIPAELQGTARALPPPKRLGDNTSASLAMSIGTAVQHLFDSQVWNWTLVELGQMPACLFGAVSANGFSCPMIESDECRFNPRTHQWSASCKANASLCKTSWQAHDDAGNLPWTTGVIVMGQAWSSTSAWAARFKGPDGRGAKWVLDRVVAAIDVHVRAQGSNGGFRTPGKDGTGQWVGGPHRTSAADPLEGWGHTSLSRAFAYVYPGMAQRGLLDIKIDSDDNPLTPNISRRSAYLTLFNMSRNYLFTIGATYCPNQELGDAKGVWSSNHAVALLEPALAWDEEQVLSTVVLPAIGLANWSEGMWKAKFGSGSSRPPGNWVEISPAGISLEWGGSLAGGYSAGYSDILADLDAWAEWASKSSENGTYAAIRDVLSRMAPAFAHFRLPSECRDTVSAGTLGTALLNPRIQSQPGPYRCLKNTAFITWRNNLNPAEQRCPVCPHTALILKSEIYRRQLQLCFAWAGNLTAFDEKPNGPHWISELLNGVPLAESYDELMSMPPSTAKLPHESGAPDFGWADNVGRSVVAKRGEERLFLTMQWRHDNVHGAMFAPAEGRNVSSNGICRVQVTNATVDRLATVACSAHAGQPLTALHVMSFGPWLVAMNSNLYHAEHWTLPSMVVGKMAREMLTAVDVTLPSSQTVTANQTLIFYIID